MKTREERAPVKGEVIILVCLFIFLLAEGNNNNIFL